MNVFRGFRVLRLPYFTLLRYEMESMHEYIRAQKIWAETEIKAGRKDEYQYVEKAKIFFEQVEKYNQELSFWVSFSTVFLSSKI